MSKHTQLANTGISWLYKNGCSVFAKEVSTENGIADALGIRTRNKKHTVYYIEAKSSRSDLICFKQKSVYARACGYAGYRFCIIHMTKLAKIHLDWKSCKDCQRITHEAKDTGIDFYYLIVADGIKVEDSLYPNWGVINENGIVIRRAKRMKRERDTKQLIENIAHVLVYKVFGKLYE